MKTKRFTSASKGRLIAILLAAVVSAAPDAFAQQERSSLQGKEHVIQRLELKDSTIVDAARLIAELSGLNLAVTEEANEKTVTLYLQDVRAMQAIETLAKVAGLWYREDEDTGVIRIMTTEEYQRDLVVFREDIIKVFTLLHPNATSVATSIQDLFGQRVILSLRVISDDELVFGGAAGGLGGIGGGGLGGQGLGGFGGGFGGGLGGGFGGGGLGGAGFGAGFGGLGGGFAGVGTGFAGVGSGAGLGAGGSRFSRPGVVGGFGGVGGIGGIGGRGLGGFGGGAGGLGLRQQLLLDESLTPEQISRLEARLDALEGGDGRVAEEAVREITQQEPLIYVTLNRQHNLVIVRTSDADAMRAIERLIWEIDRPTPQVLLEMKILEITLDDNFRSIFDIQFNSGGPLGPTADQQTQRNPFLPQPIAQAAEVAGGVGNFPLEGGTFLFQFLDDNIRARVEMLEQERRLNTIATPLLLASNNRQARIFIGEERVLTRSVSTNIVAAGDGPTTTAVTPVTEIRDVGTTLFLIPKINADRTVTLLIVQDNSTVNEQATTIPVAGAEGTIQEVAIDTVDTANISGTVVAKDGLTIAIGGLIRENITRVQTKVPVLGDLPVVGRLFRREFDQDLKTELVLLITPHVITTPTEGEVKSRWRMRELSDHPYNVGAPPVAQPYLNSEPPGRLPQQPLPATDPGQPPAEEVPSAPGGVRMWRKPSGSEG